MKNYRSTPLFEGLTDSEYKTLENSFNAIEKSFKKGDLIYSYGKEDNSLGFVVDGSAKMSRSDSEGNETLLEKLRRGSIFGDMLMPATHEGELITLSAETACTVVFMPYCEIIKSCDGQCSFRHKFLMNLFSVICHKSADLSERIEIITNRTIRDKLICYFTVCSAKHGNSTFRLDMSLSALSEYICVDRSAMMREIKKMKQDGIIDIDNKTVKLFI